jgi:hypothetical protein
MLPAVYVGSTVCARAALDVAPGSPGSMAVGVTAVPVPAAVKRWQNH